MANVGSAARVESRRAPDCVPDHAPNDSLIHLGNVAHTFGKAAGVGSRSNLVLDNVSLDVGEGEFVALVGSSGCGKTTVLNLIAGLLRPTRGSITVNGAAPTCPNPAVAYMFARDNLLPWRRAVRNVEVGLESRRGWTRRSRRQRALDMMRLVGLEAAWNKFPSQLSHGMRQRVALARTLAVDPQILLMDEPFAALDARTRLDLQGQLLRIWEDGMVAGSGKSIVFVTHDLQEAVLLSDRVVVMWPHPGRVGLECRINLPRPRAKHLGELMFTDEFRRVHHDLFQRLEVVTQGNEATVDRLPGPQS